MHSYFFLPSQVLIVTMLSRFLIKTATIPCPMSAPPCGKMLSWSGSTRTGPTAQPCLMRTSQWHLQVLDTMDACERLPALLLLRDWINACKNCSIMQVLPLLVPSWNLSVECTTTYAQGTTISLIVVKRVSLQSQHDETISRQNILYDIRVYNRLLECKTAQTVQLCPCMFDINLVIYYYIAYFQAIQATHIFLFVSLISCCVDVQCKLVWTVLVLAGHTP